MKKLSLQALISLIFILIPCIAAAADSSTSALSFTPPPADYSMVFLGNIFGIVDGVLNGSGSQIMGVMFSVFNAAVLALGGIVVIYTLLVSTMNTAHEGQMLGQKWSSTWIPLRATAGLTLLIPKASGYCLMQIFVMWVVVQGVGAADKIWDAALNYLNRGGVIIKSATSKEKLSNPTAPLFDTSEQDVATGAQAILTGQVCMLGLQKILQNNLQAYQTEKRSTNTGLCAGELAEDMQTFCNSSQVPNFINSVNILDIQNSRTQDVAGSAPTPFIADMPNFSSGIYSALNGICGQISWQAIDQSSLDNVKSTILTRPDQQNDLETVANSRAIAIQQMYLTLSGIAQTMVNNSPELGSRQKPKSLCAPAAIEQFGIPQNVNSGAMCTNSDQDCILWGADETCKNSAPIFNGTEFQGAMTNYSAIMSPTINLIKDATINYVTNLFSGNRNTSRDFIRSAQTQGWIMAGAYFRDLLRLNDAGSASNTKVDANSGLEKSQLFNRDTLDGAFDGNSCTGKYAILCAFLHENSEPKNYSKKIKPIIQLINANDDTSNKPITFSNMEPRGGRAGANASTVYGYINNASTMQLIGQPGLSSPLIELKFDKAYSFFQMPRTEVECKGGLLSNCWWKKIFNEVFMNLILRSMINAFLLSLQVPLAIAYSLFMVLPAMGMKLIFDTGIAIISAPEANPILALAKMGTYYINFAGNMWLSGMMLAAAASGIPAIGGFMVGLLMLMAPIFLSWLGIIVGVGFTTAYYIPMLPYMIFTFGAIAWLMAVIESMVAAPIIALGITHPEGHDAFGKGEQAIMILMNVFLRPAMMIIGFIAAIALSYVSVWILNAGFKNAITMIQSDRINSVLGNGSKIADTNLLSEDTYVNNYTKDKPSYGVNTTEADNYVAGVQWNVFFEYFFSILMYTMLYVTLVEKSFTLISALPDKVLRWIGGQGESYGSETGQWGQESRQKMGEASKDTSAGQNQVGKGLTAKGGEALQALKASKGAEVESSGDKPDSKSDDKTPSAGDGGGGAPPAG